MNGPPIDELTFADLRRITLEALPGVSRGEWTQHGAVDPGVTVLELLAYQFEQRLFMAEQTTDPLMRAGLRLLGLDDPAPARAARTVLSFRYDDTVEHRPKGTVVALVDDEEGREFALLRDVWLLPVEQVRWAGRLAVSGDALELTLAGSDPAPAGARLSLLFEVDAAPGVLGSWRPGAKWAAKPARLRWEAVGPDGSSAVLPYVNDRTGALRRSGIVRLPWPDVFNAAGAGERRLRVVAEEASYTEPVRILGVYANAAVAEDRVERVKDVSDQFAADLPLPGRRVRVPEAAGRLLDCTLSVTERDGAAHDWHGVASWVGVGPGERVFVVDRTRGELIFGNGLAGAILRPAAAPAATLRYGVGGGRRGNAIGALSKWAGALNPVAADDGADPETPADARRRAAGALALRDRTVTSDDARSLAEDTPGLGLDRAHVSPGLHPGFQCAPVPGALAVTIVPHADRGDEPAAWTVAPMPDAGALTATRAHLEQARLLGQEVFVLAPVYRRVAVEITASATAQTDAAHARMIDAIRRHLDPLEGGTEQRGWPFGGPVRPSALAGVAQDAAGPEVTVSRLAVGLDGGPPSECGDLEIGARELVCFDAVTITWVASLPVGRGLR